MHCGNKPEINKISVLETARLQSEKVHSDRKGPEFWQTLSLSRMEREIVQMIDLIAADYWLFIWTGCPCMLF
jgi:hypothetical protein